MWTSIVILIFTCIGMLLSVLFFPKIRIFGHSVSTYWLVTVAGMLVLFATGVADFENIGRALVQDSSINPLKILALFLSMTALSIFLDELGFFSYLASAVLKRAKSGQKKLFFVLYITVSVLTVFTSNDIIVLSFTPFICYFAKHARINPMPYLAAEFVAANTASMMFIIGNPTNIYLATSFDMDFGGYLKLSILPTLFASAVAYCMLYLLYRRKLSVPIEGEATEAHITDKPLLWVGIAHLAVCTLLLAICSYIGVEMWIVSVAAVGSLVVCTLVISLVRKSKPTALWGCVKRMPYELVPFMLSMFILIVVLADSGVTEALAGLLGEKASVWAYGATSFFAANMINNIPMSVLFSSIISSMSGGKAALGAMMATVIGSNIGAYLTPVGALAGIMFSSMLSKRGIKVGYTGFLKLGVCVAVPALVAALAGLQLMMLLV